MFDHGHIRKRYFSAPLEWFDEPRSLKERNDLYIQMATELGVEAIHKCLNNRRFLQSEIHPSDIDGLIYLSTTGLSTPSIDAKIINTLSFGPHTKRIPIWGLGCAGGAAGLARAHEFCLAHPTSAVIVLCIELCSLTFQHGDKSKSNLVGTSLFADGAACVLVAGEQSPLRALTVKELQPVILGSNSTLMPNSEDVMGWNIEDSGFQVVFSRDIPSIVQNFFRPVIESFLGNYALVPEKLTYFIAHPGGQKVLDAYSEALHLHGDYMHYARKVLENYGNMSSPTVLFVLEEVMQEESKAGDKGLTVSLGPGFSAECVLLEWRRVS